MKKLFSIVLMAFCALTIFAQKDVTTFLGIPVDGFKADMRKKLIEKGFTPKIFDGKEYFEGEFNGHEVDVYVVTNNNKVWRIMLADRNHTDEANIKIRFNNLCQQFKNNERYSSSEDWTIPEDEDISYEMSVHDKIYEAIFFQKSIRFKFILTDDEAKKSAEETIKKPVWFRISENYGRYYLCMYYDNEYNKANGEDL